MSEFSLKKKILYIFFPKFSELDLFVVACLVFVAGIHKRAELAVFLSQLLTMDSGDLLRLMLLAVIGVYAVFVAVYHAFSRREMSEQEINSTAPVFYFVVAVATIISLRQMEAGNSVEAVLLLVTMVRSLGCLIILRVYKNKANLYLERMDRLQISKALLLAVVTATPLTYLWFAQESFWLSAALQAYYVVTTLTSPMISRV